MTLDPIVSLSVALAEAPGTCAFFLGSGVSRDAGVPTGWEVLRSGLHRLRQLEQADDRQVSDEELDQWLVKTGREAMSYSELLAAIAPDMAVRREYLAGFFEGVEPGATHEALADLAAQGMIKVFVTTNFDRLLEHALQARGIEPVVIASDADLDAAVPREHAGCIVLKPHGDYLRQTIRNTPEELAQLDPGLTAELTQIFDRYGIVVLGYSGSDEGISTLLRARRSRYGLWWVARRQPEQQAADLIETTGGRVIGRGGAAEFLTDLRARLAVFEAHPTGQTPAVVHEEALGLLRHGDAVGLDELLRRESNNYEHALSAVVDEAHQRNPNDPEAARAVWAQMLPALERRLATLLVLALHDGDGFAHQVGELARGLERRQPRSGYAVWGELPLFAATWLGYAIGALMMRLERIEPLAPIVRTTWTARSNSRTGLLVWLPATQAACSAVHWPRKATGSHRPGSS
jgi:SIR2-like domain